MTSDAAAIRTYFAKLGLETEIADLYLALHAHGPQTISELSRNSHVERTRIYRLIDQLMESGLLEVETQHTRAILKPAPVANLRILINRRAAELQGLQDELQMVEQVLGRNSLSSPAARVQFYQGTDAIRQMFWNIAKAHSEVCAILRAEAPIEVDGQFMERWTAVCNTANVHFRVLASSTNDADSTQNWFTGQAKSHHLKHAQSRNIAEILFPVTYTAITYDDVVASFIRKAGEVYGIETHNTDMETTQHAVFELLWSKQLVK